MKKHCLSFVLVSLIPLAASAEQPADSAAENAIVTNKREFQIPIQVNPVNQPDIKEVQLYVSTDSGKKWKKIAAVPPDAKAVTFTAAGDGVHWFSVIIVAKDGTSDPASPKKLKPLIKVQVKVGKE